MKRYDVLVAGGGLAGIGAAIAAAREGLRVLLIEKNCHLGGAASNALVNPFMRFYLRRTDENGNETRELLNAGIFGEILRRLRECGGMNEKSINRFNVEHLKLLLEVMCEEYRVDLLYDTVLTSATVTDGFVRSVQLFNRDGISIVEASYFIDCTGDANLAVAAGVPCRIGRESDGLCQPMTLSFWIAGVDIPEFRRCKKEINDTYRDYQRRGLIQNPRERIHVYEHMAPGVLHFNTTRVVGMNPTSAEDMTKAQLTARKQVLELYSFLKENFPCFSGAELLMTAPEIGVRESRMIDGDYLYTAEDILNYRQFEDSVACGNYDVDIHNPSGTGTEVVALDPSRYYTIPYRSLIPKGVRNLLVAGRCISSTHEAQSAYRIMPIVCNIGEGAGAAIACAYRAKGTVRDVQLTELHALLDRHGARY